MSALSKAAAQAGSLFETAWSVLRRRLKPDPPAPTDVRRILVLGYAAIGDLIFFLPVLEGLRGHYPRARITFLGNHRYPTTEEIIPATGLIDNIWLWDWDGPDAGARSEILRRIRDGGFDLVLLTLAAPAQYFQPALRDIPLRAGHCRSLDMPHAGWSPIRYAWRRLRLAIITGELVRRVVLNRTAWIGAGSEHTSRRDLRLLDALGAARPASAKPPLRIPAACRDFAQAALSALNPAKRKIAVQLGPPRTQYHKIWPAEKFGRLCARLMEEMPAEIVLVGASAEAPSAAEARRTCAGIDRHSWIGKCSLFETLAIVERCDLLLCCDTGIAKAAMALGTPTATIYGPSDPEEIGVLWDRGRHLEIRTGIACNPCARFGMAVEGADVLNYSNCGHHDCLRKLETEFVLDALRGKYASLFGDHGKR